MSTLLKPKTAAELRDVYLRQEMMPTIFCDGCGLGNVLNYTLWALDELQVDLDQVVFVSGIGCSSRLSGYVNADGMHTTHGRALSFASGIKAANPNLKVIVFTGDGDGAGIGGNHLLHTIRRNMDMTVILVNNYIYGMTGGQSAPTTPIGGLSTTTPYGNVEYPMDICALALALEAPYVARWTVNQPYPPIKSIAQGIAKRGFALIEMLVPCPTAYGGRNGLKGVEAIWQWYRENTVLLDDFEHIMEFGTLEEQEEIKHKLKVGVLRDTERESFEERWAKLVEQVKL
ncbi:thiamine pyrophosphate-dependent enzyme [Candidatus Viridilinea mediisalina]|uniref:2-oxoglutarate synthase n=1 Tax=Candidatus Viridilinea mediisalina TaxID=2024553 RepID=A0A2A6RJK5_9CHLR|nr:thiamine pyrophosphate-dependent enzyme [Candidatus Viridilinea mediisalina]PDW03048.1 2-oxoglutarate synthase [Candidatus Viridilinea mediisalina]